MYETMLFLVICLVAGIVGWCGASLRYLNLAWRVSEMEAALVHYWDRIRKRVRVEPNEKAPAAPMTDAEIMAIAHRSGILSDRGS